LAEDSSLSFSSSKIPGHTYGAIDRASGHVSNYFRKQCFDVIFPEDYRKVCDITGTTGHHVFLASFWSWGYLDELFLDIPVKFAKVTIRTRNLLVARGECIQLQRYDGELELFRLPRKSFEDTVKNIEAHQRTLPRSEIKPFKICETYHDAVNNFLTMHPDHGGINQKSLLAKYYPKPPSFDDSKFESAPRRLVAPATGIIAPGISNKYVKRQEAVHNQARLPRPPEMTPGLALI
jgi:hypothetical protein